MSYSNSPFGTGALSMAGATTLSTLRSDTYDILNELQTSNVYSTSIVDQEINNQITKVCMRKKWKFLMQKQPILAGSNTTNDDAITTADTTIDLGDTTNFQSAGAIYLNGDIVTYTGITTNTLTGVSGIDIAHESGEHVEPLYKVPSDFWRMPVLNKQNSGSDRFREMFYVDSMDWDRDTTGTSAIDSKYTIVTDNNESAYIRVHNVSQGDYLYFYYLKRPNVLSGDDDVCVIPDPWALKVIPKLTAYKLMIIRNDDMDGLGSKIKQEAMEELFEMEKYYGQREETWSKLTTSTYRSGMGRNNRTRIRI